MDTQTRTTSPRWLSLDAACHYTGVSKRQLQVWNAKGFIKSANIVTDGATRGRRVYDRQSIDDFIEQFVGAPPSEIAMNKNREAAGCGAGS